MKFRMNGLQWHVLFYGNVQGIVYAPMTGETLTMSTVDIVNMSHEDKF